MITATFKYHDDSDAGAAHVDTACAARAAFMKRAGVVKSAQYAAYRYKNQYQLITTRSRREGGEENCAMMAMEASLNGMSPDAFKEEYLSTVSQDSTVWRMATMLAGTGCSDMVFLVTSEGGRRSIKEIEGKGCLDRMHGYTLIHIIQAHVDTTVGNQYVAHVDTFVSPRVERRGRDLIQTKHANVVWSHTTTEKWRADLPYGERNRSPNQFLTGFGDAEGTPTFTISTAQSLTLGLSTTNPVALLKAPVKMSGVSPVTEVVELPEETLEWYLNRMGSLMVSDRLSTWAETSGALMVVHVSPKAAAALHRWLIDTVREVPTWSALRSGVRVNTGTGCITLMWNGRDSPPDYDQMGVAQRAHSLCTPVLSVVEFSDAPLYPICPGSVLIADAVRKAQGVSTPISMSTEFHTMVNEGMPFTVSMTEDPRLTTSSWAQCKSFYKHLFGSSESIHTHMQQAVELAVTCAPAPCATPGCSNVSRDGRVGTLCSDDCTQSSPCQEQHNFPTDLRNSSTEAQAMAVEELDSTRMAGHQQPQTPTDEERGATHALVQRGEDIVHELLQRTSARQEEEQTGMQAAEPCSPLLPPMFQRKLDASIAKAEQQFRQELQAAEARVLDLEQDQIAKDAEHRRELEVSEAAVTMLRSEVNATNAAASVAEAQVLALKQQCEELQAQAGMYEALLKEQSKRHEEEIEITVDQMTTQCTQITQRLRSKLESVSSVVAEVEDSGRPLSSDVIVAVQTLGRHYVEHAGMTQHHGGRSEEEYASLLSSMTSMAAREQAGKCAEEFLRQRASEVMQTITQHLQEVGLTGCVMPEWSSGEMVDLETQASQTVQAVQTLVALSPARCSECNGCSCRMICEDCVECLHERAVQEGLHTQVQNGDSLWLTDASRDRVYYLRSTQQLLDRHVWVAHNYDNKELSVITNERLTLITSKQEWVMAATTEDMAEIRGVDEMECDEMVSFAKRQGDRFEILPFMRWRSRDEAHDRCVLQYEADPMDPSCRKIYNVKIVTAGEKSLNVKTMAAKRAKRYNNNNTVVLQRHRHGEYTDSSVADSVDSSLARDEEECTALAEEQIGRHDLVAALTRGFKELKMTGDADERQEHGDDLAGLIAEDSREVLSQEHLDTIRAAARQFRGGGASAAPGGPPQQGRDSADHEQIVSAVLRAVESSLRYGGAEAEQNNGSAVQHARNAGGDQGPQCSASTGTYTAGVAHPHTAEPSMPRAEAYVQSTGPQPHPQYGGAPLTAQVHSQGARPSVPRTEAHDYGADPQPHPQYGGVPAAGHTPGTHHGGPPQNPSTSNGTTFSG